MAALTLRSAAGRPLSNAEVDGNFSALNTELGQKLVAASNLSDLPNTATARTNLGLGSVENKSSATIRSELTSNNVTSALGFTPYNSTNPAGYITSGASITGTAAGLTNNSSWLLNRGGVAETSIDSAIANGFYTVNRVEHSTSLFSWNASGSTGPVQLDFHHAGSFSFRSKTDSASWNAWKTVLTNSNYNNYSPSLTGLGASGTWGINVSGTSGMAYHVNVFDTRAGQLTPNGYYGYKTTFEFTDQLMTGWHSAMTIKGWHDGYAAWQIIGGSSDTTTHENWYLRSGVNTSWNPMRAILHSGNYNNYAPSLTGSGASGTWGINITGSANSASVTSSYGGYAHVGTGMSPFYNWGGHDGGAAAPSDSTYTTGISVGSHPNDPNYGFQIANNMWNNGLWTRRRDNNGFGPWVRLLDTVNFTDYALSLNGGTVTGAVAFTGGVSFGPSPGDPYPYIGARAVPAGDPNAGNERTELILFHSNDPAPGAGPDFITLRAPCIRLQTYYNDSVNDPNNMVGSVNSMYLDFNGNATFRGAVTQSSDERLKSEWQTLSSDFVEKLAQVKNGTFLLNEDPVRQVGVSAQSLQTALPEAVSGDEVLTVAYGNAALASVIELAKKIVELEAKIELLMQNAASN